MEEKPKQFDPRPWNVFALKGYFNRPTSRYRPQTFIHVNLIGSVVVSRALTASAMHRFPHERSTLLKQFNQ